MDHLRAMALLADSFDAINDEERSQLQADISELKSKINSKLNAMRYAPSDFLSSFLTKDSKSSGSHRSHGSSPDTRVHNRFRVQKSLLGHHGRVQDIAWSQDSTRLVSAAQDGRLLTWNTETANKRTLVTLKSPSVMTCSFSCHNTHIASGGFDMTVSVFNTDPARARALSEESGQSGQTTSHLNSLHSRISSEAHLIDSDHDGEEHDLNSPHANKANKASKPNKTKIAKNSDADEVAGSSSERAYLSEERASLAKWVIEAPEITLTRHEGYVSDVEFLSHENGKLLSCSGDKNIYLWDLNKCTTNAGNNNNNNNTHMSKNSKSIKSSNDGATPIGMFRGHTGDIQTLKQNPSDKNMFLTGDIEAQCKVWDVRLSNFDKQRDSQCVATFMNRHGKGSKGENEWKEFAKDEGDIEDVGWFPDGKSFCNGNEFGKIRLFDLRSGCQLNEYNYEKYSEKKFESVSKIDFTRGGRYIIAGFCGVEPYCLCFNTLTGQVECEMNHTERASCVAVAPDGCSIMTGSWDSKIRMWA